jgi:hypothetical protein
VTQRGDNEANVELDRVFGGEDGESPIRFGAQPSVSGPQIEEWELQANEASTSAGREFLRSIIPRTGVSPWIGGRFCDVDSILAIEAEARAASQERPQPTSIDADWSDAVDRYMPGVAQERPPIDVLREVEDVIMSEPWWPRAGAIRRRAVMEKIRARLSRSVASPEPSE